MRIVKIVAILLLAYVGIVVIFESSLGYFQPQNDNTLTLAVTDETGAVHERVLTRIEVEDQVYVAVNHWPRMWYYRTLEYPEVTVTHDGVTVDATAVPVTSDDEAARVTEARPASLVFRLLTGFPPRYFVRLDQKIAEPTAATPPSMIQ